MLNKYNTLIIGVFIVLAYITLTQRAQLDVNKIENLHAEISKSEINEARIRSDYIETKIALRYIHSQQNKYRNKNGQFAHSLKELGVEEGSISPENIKNIKIKSNGKMQVSLNNKFGNNIVLNYYPIDTIVASDESIDMYNDARIAEEQLEEVHYKRSLRKRRTSWKCRTNFKLKDPWCKFVKDLH